MLHCIAAHQSRYGNIFNSAPQDNEMVPRKRCLLVSRIAHTFDTGRGDSVSPSYLLSGLDFGVRAACLPKRYPDYIWGASAYCGSVIETFEGLVLSDISTPFHALRPVLHLISADEAPKRI
jgi:hypothetical protein